MLGKFTGTLFGYLLYGYAGAAMGLLAGFAFDRHQARRPSVLKDSTHLSDEQAERIRQSFFHTTFLVMGHVSKSDGLVSPSQIKHTEGVMQQMGLNDDLRASAIQLFTKGKRPEFNLEKHVKLFKKECASNKNLYRMFFEIQVQVALSDGVMVKQEERILLRLASLLGIPAEAYRKIVVLVRASMGLGDDHTQRYNYRASGKRSSKRAVQHSVLSPVRAAYTLLSVSAEDDSDTVKKAYRKLISQHHPDKLMAEGMPEEGLRLATDKTQQIRRAYEQIKLAKGWA